MKGKLILENGMVFEGKLFGNTDAISVGEVVFNTSMTGYQEILTDPSYYGQIVTMTYPLIGNYGINLQDTQSNSVKVRGFIVKEPAKLPNNFRCEMLFSMYLRQNNIVALKGIDTRALTKVIRDHGTLKGIITSESLTKKEIEKQFKSFDNSKAVEAVTTQTCYTLKPKDQRINKKIAVYDFGIKTHILEEFLKRGCELMVFPMQTPAKEILQSGAQALFLSNGPGDPEDLKDVIEEIKKTVGKLPMIGICLGHQLLALALGGETEKLKFGHRGANHPVKDIEKNRVFITAQNHGYVVKTLPKDTVMTQYNVNDRSIEGMKCEKHKIMSVQYHPEASPGPIDSTYVFDDFLNWIEE